MNLSILDFGNVADAPRLVSEAARSGYTRYWVGEHHSIRPNGQCTNPLLLGLLLAGATNDGIRIGSGGVCLGYHPPYRIAEDARSIEFLMPGRFDLGVTQGMGLPPALREAVVQQAGGQSYYDKLADLHGLLTGRLAANHSLYSDQCPPAPPLWVLGNNQRSAEWAGKHGVGFCFSLHHAQVGCNARAVLGAYRRSFMPSPEFENPATILVVGTLWKPREFPVEMARDFPHTLTVGSADECAEKLWEIGNDHGVNEVMVMDLDVEGTAKRYRALAKAIGLRPRRS